MLQTNLSTRPFYNTRAVQVVLLTLGAALVAATIVNLTQLVRLSADERTLGARAAEAEEEAARLRAEAERVRQQIDPGEMREVATAAAEANAIIDLRTFSWTGLFTRFEMSMPDGVRFTALEPTIDRDGQFVVAARVQARRVQDLEAFLDALEETGMFRDVLAAEEVTNPDGLIDALVRAIYLPDSASASAGFIAVGEGNTGG
jgi:hypothetical protein